MERAMARAVAPSMAFHGLPHGLPWCSMVVYTMDGMMFAMVQAMRCRGVRCGLAHDAPWSHSTQDFRGSEHLP